MATWEEALKTVQGRHEATRYELPVLNPGSSSLLEWLAQLKSDIQEWVTRHLLSHIGGASAAKPLKWILITGLSMAGLALVYVCVQALRKRIRSALEPDWALAYGVPAGVASPQRWLEEAIAAALEKNDFSRASRLRWKLHLLKRRERHDATPAELLPAGASYYRLMFGVGGSDHEYRELVLRLSGLEGGPDA